MDNNRSIIEKCHTRCQFASPIVVVDFPRKEGATIYVYGGVQKIIAYF